MIILSIVIKTFEVSKHLVFYFKITAS